MSSEGTTTAVEIGRSLYIYTGDQLFSSTVVTESPMATVIETFRSNAADFRHIRICHSDWDTLLDWEDRVAKSSLASLLDSTWSRRLTVLYTPQKERA